MKHLKTYNEELQCWQAPQQHYELLPDNIIQELKEICYELSDVGYCIEFRNLSNGPPANNLSTRIVIYKDRYVGIYKTNYRISYSVVEETIERIKEYVNSIGYNIITSPENKIVSPSHYFLFFTKK